jgi:pre-60S factor REI1
MDDDLGTSVTHPYTCLSCSLAFVDTASQREHYVTDLHRYNSKRRVAGLGPVTYELFNEKVLARTDETEEVAQGRLNCKACK